MQCNRVCKKVSAVSKQNQTADSGLCNVVPHINRLRKNRARFLAEILVRNVLVSQNAYNKYAIKKNKNRARLLRLAYVTPRNEDKEEKNKTNKSSETCSFL